MSPRAYPRPLPPILCPHCGHDITSVGLQAIADVIEHLTRQATVLKNKQWHLEREAETVAEQIHAFEVVLDYRRAIDAAAESAEETTP